MAPPLPRPSKIVCLARTFRAHAAELGNDVPTEPLYFLKAPSAVIGPGEAIRIPPTSELVHHEGEVAVIIGARLSAADVRTAEASISGWTLLNDVTARDLQRKDGGRFTRAKGFDTFCPIADERLATLDWRRCRVQCRVNGALRQDGGLDALTHTPAGYIAAISACMTLEPGDIVSLGTPAGVGPLVAGDTVEVRLLGPGGEALMTLENPVIGPGEAPA